MKFRTDFVTNSSSSSYTTVSVHLQEGNSLGCFWEDWTAALADDFLLFQKGEISVKTMAICFAFGSSEELFYSIEEADWQTPQELDEALAALSEERLQTILQERACQEDYEAF